MMSTPSKLWKSVKLFAAWYSRQQSHRPYTTQLCTTPLIYCTGDLSAQMIGGDGYDLSRTLRNLAVGAVISLPSYKWFMLLGRHFNYPSAALSTAVKVLVNQAVYTPLVNVYFFAFHAILRGERVGATVDRVRTGVATSIPRSFLYWPLVTALNFTYVPPQSRSVAASTAAVFWQSYMSYLNRQVEKSTEGPGSSVEKVRRRPLRRWTQLITSTDDSLSGLDVAL